MSSPDWITLHIRQDSSNVSMGFFTHEIDVRPSNILSMTVMCHAEDTGKRASNIPNAHTMIRLNEPEDQLADDDINVARSLRQLNVFESIEQIRELMGHPSRNGLPREQFIPQTAVSAGATSRH